MSITRSIAFMALAALFSACSGGNADQSRGAAGSTESATPGADVAPASAPDQPTSAGLTGAAAPAGMPDIPGMGAVRTASDPSAHAAEIRTYLAEIRPLVGACTASVTVRSLIIMPDGSMMRTPPTPRTCATLEAEVQVWEERLAATQ